VVYERSWSAPENHREPCQHRDAWAACCERDKVGMTSPTSHTPRECSDLRITSTIPLRFQYFNAVVAVDAGRTVSGGFWRRGFEPEV
jgi:hypothetical protein